MTDQIQFPVYLDHHATTPVAPSVIDVVTDVMKNNWGNASSPDHAVGKKAHEAVKKSREQIASFIGAEASEIIFTSGATESNNLAIKGVMRRYREKGVHAVTSAIEHPSVLDVFKELESEGFEVTYLPVSEEGVVDPAELKKAVRKDTVLISIMTANNEIGTIQPVQDIGTFAKANQILFHTDATQAVGKIGFNVEDSAADLVSFSAHKLYGPKGIGALYVRDKNPHVRLKPIMNGGGHENELRSGTLNVAGICGFAEAIRLCSEQMDRDFQHTSDLRNLLLEKLKDGLDEMTINGSMKNRLPNNLNISIAYVEGESLIKGLERLAVSSSSACSSLGLKVSYVLKAIGLHERFIHTAIRFGIGRYNTKAEIEFAADYVIEHVRNLRKLSELYSITKSRNGNYKAAIKPERKVM